jgi:hypothetical protein
MPNATEIENGKVSNKRRFDKRDWDTIAENTISQWEDRKRKRSDREKAWKEIDRQIAMEPDVQFKKLPDGRPDTNKIWMAETEMPFQAQALEVLTADARRLMFPNTGLCFRAHAETTDEYFERVDFQALIHGDELEVPSRINQDNADKLVEGFLAHLFAQTDFQTRIDRINAEAFKYGMGVGRARMETKNVFINEARGVTKETKKIPVLVPVSVKNLYLDDPVSSMHTSQVLGPAHIAVDYMKLENLQIAANRGSSDPDSADGGWMAEGLKNLIADKDGYVTILEMEGDIIVPRKTVRSMVIPGGIVTVVIGGKDSGGAVSRGVVRFRWRKNPFSSYLLFPYHYESANDPYPSGPLMKGRPVQILASDAANRLLDSAMLKNAPPVGYDRSDMVFAANGGPQICPTAKWGTTDPVKVYTEIGGDPTALTSMFVMASKLYAELTGVLPGRLGAQTNSHTTAFAKDAELQRGAVRTVDYVTASGNGPMLQWFNMAYKMGRDSIGPRESISFYIAAYGGFVKIDKSHLPDAAMFDWLGAGGPQDESQKMQQRVNALLLAAKLDQFNVSTGQPPRININNAIDAVLRDGGWIDLDAIVNTETSLTQSPGPGPAVAAVQNLIAQQPQ